MTPTELVNAILRVAPGKDPPAHCHGWTISGRLVPERGAVEYVASLTINLPFDVADGLREYPGMLEAALRVHAEDICEMDDRIRSLADELTRAAKQSQTGYDDGH